MMESDMHVYDMHVYDMLVYDMHVYGMHVYDMQCAGAINKSLSTLGGVIHALATGMNII